MQDQRLYRDCIDAELLRMRHELESLKTIVQEEADGRNPTKFTRYVEAIEQKSEQISRRLDDLTTQGSKAKRDIEKGLKEAWDRVAIATSAAKAAKPRLH